MTSVELIQLQGTYGVCVCVRLSWTHSDSVCVPGSGGVLVGHFWTSSQQLSLRTPLLRFPGEMASCGRSLLLQRGWMTDVCLAGPGPARDRMPVVVRRLRISLLQYAVVSSAAAVTAIAAMSGLALAALSRKRWYTSAGPSTPHGL